MGWAVGMCQTQKLLVLNLVHRVVEGSQTSAAVSVGGMGSAVSSATGATSSVAKYFSFAATSSSSSSSDQRRIGGGRWARRAAPRIITRVHGVPH